jgi:hypothetical protein
MTRLLVVLAVSFLSACAASGPTSYRQAAAPMPAPGPLIVQQPPTYPGATYAPVGAGLPEVGQPGRQGASVPRSPDKRILPPTKEPAVYAADGAPRAVSAPGLGVTVLGVGFDLGLELKPARAAHECAKAVNDASDSTIHWSKHTRRFSEEATRCIAARALLRCSKIVRDELQNQKRMFADFHAEHAAVATEAAERFKEAFCKDVVLNPTQDLYLSWLYERTEGVRPKR